MSITDELRKYVKDHTNWDVALTTYPPQRTMTYHEGAMDAIADRIDAEHESKVAETRNDALYHANEKDMAELGWIHLPKDADGEYIHIGDVLAPPADCDDYVPLQVTSLTYDGYEKEWFFDGEAGGFCGLAGQHMDVAGWTHYRKHKQTVEDVLEQFAVEVERAGGVFDVADDVWTRFAVKLRLAGDGE